MQTIRIGSWNELQDALFEDTWNADISRFRSNMAYRGMSDAQSRLLTSLVRLGEPAAHLEKHLLRNFRKYARRDIISSETVWGWLSVAQHHGLPTRLLDWTYSPLVAAHFATSDLDRYDRDGVIWCVDYVEANEELPEALQAVLHAEGSNAFTVEMLHEGAPTLDELRNLRDEPFVLFLEPPSLDERIVNQFALFSLMSCPEAALDDWLDQHPHLVRRIVIPAEVKWEVRDKLDQSNITERVLFPGLDGLSRWLKRHYTPVER